MTPIPADKPRVTLVVTARERHGLTERTLASIVENTQAPYGFIYASGATPPALMARLRERAPALGLAIADVDPKLFPNQIRRQLIGAIDTDYVVFVDNDVVVEPGWLDALVACADETGAGAVGPLYLVGGDDRPPRIHMAGGKLEWTETPAGRKLSEDHVDMGEDASAPHVREAVDFLEYHCMLVRTSLARDGALFDPDIACVHEHIDLATTLRERGHRTWSEPKSRVTYLGRGLWNAEDMQYLRYRWSRAAADASIAAFCRKWNVIDDDESFQGVRSFVRFHKSRIDPLREGLAGHPRLAEAMRPGELPQTRSALLDLAIASGWKGADLENLAKRHDVAAILANAGYRPCGRPFIAHLIGTAGVLLRYGFVPELVFAGLLHAAYSHCPELPPAQKTSIETVCDALGGARARLEKIVRAYTRLSERLGDLAERYREAEVIPLGDAELVAIAAANEIDMAMSGEFRYTMRDSRVDDDTRAFVRRVATTIGCAGLSKTLDACAQIPDAPRELKTQSLGSYRIVGLQRVSMVSRAFAEFDRRTGGA
ncbi:MAG: glycosyltransferase family 2 protein [Vicinamibacteria bacterium]